MKRWLFHIAAGFSLLVFVACVPGWVWSHWHGALIGELNSARTRGIGAATLPGKVQLFSVYDSTSTLQKGNTVEVGKPGDYDLDRDLSGWSTGTIHRRFGFFWCSIPLSGIAIRAVGIPIWFIMLVASILPIVWFRSRRKRKRQRQLGLCKSCGYDLRASIDRCPECGTIIHP